MAPKRGRPREKAEGGGAGLGDLKGQKIPSDIWGIGNYKAPAPRKFEINPSTNEQTRGPKLKPCEEIKSLVPDFKNKGLGTKQSQLSGRGCLGQVGLP